MAPIFKFTLLTVQNCGFMTVSKIHIFCNLVFELLGEVTYSNLFRRSVLKARIQPLLPEWCQDYKSRKNRYRKNDSMTKTYFYARNPRKNPNMYKLNWDPLWMWCFLTKVGTPCESWDIFWPLLGPPVNHVTFLDVSWDPVSVTKSFFHCKGQLGPCIHHVTFFGSLRRLSWGCKQKTDPKCFQN